MTLKQLIDEELDTEIDESLNPKKLIAGAALALGLVTAGVPKVHAQDSQSIEHQEQKVEMKSISEVKFSEAFHLAKEGSIKRLSDGTQLVKYESENGKYVAYANFRLLRAKDGSFSSTEINKTGKEFFTDLVGYGGSISAFYKVGNEVAGHQAYAIVLPAESAKL